MKILNRLSLLLVIIICLAFFAVPNASGYEDYSFAYEIENGEAIFYGCADLRGNVTIPSTLGGYPVTTIIGNPYNGCGYITSLTIPDSVTTIGKDAFSGFTKVTSITLGSGVATIDESAFYGADCLNSIRVDENNPYFSNDGYGVLFDKNKTKLIYAGTGISDYTIPSGVQTVAKDAFLNSSNLTSLTIPASVTTIGEGSLGGIKVKSYVVDAQNPSYSSDGYGVLFNKDKTVLIEYPCAAAHYAYEIPKGVTAIKDNAFSNSCDLHGVSIPDSTNYIGSNAFSDCDYLQSVIIPAGVEHIYSGTFSGCWNLTSVRIPNGILSIGDEAFQYCNRLTSITIPEGVTSIGRNAFAFCSGLSKVTIPESVTSLGIQAFGHCKNLTSVNIPDAVTVISDHLFYDCYKLESITIPEGVTHIGNVAFYGCSSLTSVRIPDSVVSIGYGTFAGCSELTDISIGSGVTEIGMWAFSSCKKLTSITIPDNVISLGERAFESCSGLTTVTLPDSIVAIEYHTFYKCDSLTSVTIGSGVTQIGSYAFYCCPSLTAIWVDPQNPYYRNDEQGVLYDKNKTLLVKFPENHPSSTYTVPDSVVAIGNAAFSNCTGLIAVELPSGLTSVGSSGFSGSSNLADAYYDGTEQKWATVTIDRYNTELENATMHFCDHDHVFTNYISNNDADCDFDGTKTAKCDIADCDAADTQPDIGTALGHSFGEYAFNNDATCTQDGTQSASCSRCGLVITCQLSGSAKGHSFGAYTPNNDATCTADGTETAKCERCNETKTRQLPGTALGHSFTNYIYDNNATHLEDGTKTAKCDRCDITDTVVEPGSKVDAVAAGKCGDDLTWRLDEDGTLTVSGNGEMDDYYFNVYDRPWQNDIDKIRKVVILNGVTNISGSAFERCKNLEELILGDSVTVIDAHAFDSCEKLTHITFSSGLTKICLSAFSGCDSLTAITIPGNVESIGEYAFGFCENLQTVILENGVKTIKGRAFSDCPKLQNICIPASVENIEGRVFAHCTSLTNIQIDKNEHYSSDEFGVLFNADKTVLLEATDTQTSYVVPDSVTSIAVDAFYGNKKLTDIVFGTNLKEINKESFSYCENLKSVTMQEGVQTIGSRAFYQCNSLQSITIPASVSSLYGDSFGRCGKLTGIWVHPDNAWYCSDDYGVLYNKDMTTLLRAPGALGDYTIPQGVKVVGSSAFEYINFASVTLPDSITTIESSAFSYSKLVSLNIPGGVTEIGSQAFYGCKNLTDVYYELSQEQWGEIRVASNNESLRNATIHYNCHAHTFAEYISNNDATCTADGTKTATCSCTGCRVTDTQPDPGTKLEHSWDAGSYTPPVQKEDGVEQGYTTYTCTGCGETKYVADPNPTEISVQPVAVATESGNAAQFCVETQGEVVSYQWQYRKLYKWFDTSLEGCNTDILTVPATGTRNGYDYRCVITFANGAVFVTDPAELTVKTEITNVVGPKDQTVVLGYKGQFTASAEGEGIKYQWQYKRPGSDLWIDTAMEGAAKPTVMIETTTARDGYQYRCEITDVTGNTVYTEPATMRVLSFTAHPEDQFAGVNSSVQFTVDASASEGFTYQWQYRKSATANWSNTTMSGYNTATLTVNATAARNGYEYRCVLTGSKSSQIASKGAVLHVGDPVVFTAQPADMTCAVGEIATFTVVAENAYTYQWQFYNPINAVWKNTTADGNTTDTLNVTVKSNNNNYQYRCIVYGLNGLEYTSNAATLTIG